MRKALLPMIASLALCGAATVALIATNARAAQTAKRPVMMAMAAAPGMGPSPEVGPPGAMMGGPGDMGAGPPPDGKIRERIATRITQMCKDIYAHKAGEMAFLEAKLTLTPAQAPLFARWKQVNLDIAQHRSGDCNSRVTKLTTLKAGERPSPIDRMAREEQELKTRLADLEVERPALAALYNALTPDQRNELARPGMGRPMGRMIGMMHRPGMGPMGGPPGMMGPHEPGDMPPPPPPSL